jgi:hypothetical protein
VKGVELNTKCVSVSKDFCSTEIELFQTIKIPPEAPIDGMKHYYQMREDKNSLMKGISKFSALVS